VVKLDELMAHLKTVRELASRLSSLRDSAPPAEKTDAPPEKAEKGATGGKSAVAAAKTSSDELATTLQQMAERLAKDHQKKFKLAITGLGELPSTYRNTVKDVLIQMLRNAAVHGIEPSEVRRAQTKDDVGAVRVEFRKKTENYELTFEDDGGGISPDQLKAAAVRKQLVTPEEAESMDTRAAMALIFRPGFSTQENVSMDAGRGVGMDVVAKSVYALGGKIGVTTNPGKFTRFKIVLPVTQAADSAVA
jgi:chemotaxis protein histidine kinase CheA